MSCNSLVEQHVADDRGRGRNATRSRRVVFAVGAVVGVILLSGCRTTQELEPLSAPPSWEAIVETQRTRLERLLPLRAAGPVEMRWRDERGRHFENCRGDLMLRGLTESALDLRKVGERFMLVGSDAERQWIFDLRRGEEQAWIRRRGVAWSDAATASTGPPISIDVDLAELFGLFDPEQEPLVDSHWTPISGHAAVVLGPAEAPRRVYFDAATLLPSRIELLGPGDELLVAASLDRYEPVEREGLPPGARPRFPTRVWLSATAGDGEIVLFLRPPETTPRIPERMFSLDALLAAFRPRVVHAAGLPAPTLD